MPSKVRGSKIKKSRLMLILKSRKITITKLAEDIGYNRRALNYAINREYMDNQTLDDICDYLDVSTQFLTGAYPLRRLKPEYRSHSEDYGCDPSGYDIPPYMLSKTTYFESHKGGWVDVYRNFLIGLGEIGVMESFNDKDRIYFDSAFVKDNSAYLVPPIRSTVIERVKSAYYQDENYLTWAEAQKAESEKSITDYFDVIEDPEGDNNA